MSNERQVLIVDASYVEEANKIVENLGYGPNMFCVECTKKNGTTVTDYACSGYLNEFEAAKISDALKTVKYKFKIQKDKKNDFNATLDSFGNKRKER